MKSIKPWVQGLGVSEAAYEAWLREAPKNEPFTNWCLETGKISINLYLNWAQEHFSLAQIKSDFFKVLPNLSLWKKINSVANWSSHMIPISEWDGVVFIACIEPDLDIRWSFPVKYLLADPEDLRTYWHNLAEASQEEVETVAAVTTAPALIQYEEVPAALPIPIEEIQAISEVASITDLSQSLSLPPLDEPSGLNLSKLTQIETLKTFDPMEQLLKKYGVSETPPATEKVEEIDAPTNLTWTAPQQTATALDFAPTKVTHVVPAAPAPKRGAQTYTPAPSSVDSHTHEPKRTPAPVVHAPVLVQTHSVAQTNSVVASPTQAAPHSSLSPISQTDFVSMIKNDFRGGMLLGIKSDQFTPILWDSHFKATDTKALGQWTLALASAFRVAYRTKIPYLGHIVDTGINTSFFKMWGFDSKPDSILIQPIMLEQNVQYFILGLVDPGKKNHQVLAAGERIEKEFLIHLRNKSNAA